ncbi:MAG TPA: hypothetical protein VKP30_27770 [Polyangiaceae bacterium]|nr:hypothetical protein [Polyangiaceae bacterium]
MIPVFVDAGSPEQASVQALYAACTQIVTPEYCAGSPYAAAIARVVWDTPLRARIEIEQPRAKIQRTVDFQAVDLPEARWQAVGLLVGALLREHRAEPRTAALIAPPKPTEDRNEKAESARELRSARGATAPRQPLVPVRPPPDPRRTVPQPPTDESSTGRRGQPTASGQAQAVVWVGLGGLAGAALDAQRNAGDRIRAGAWFEVGASLWKGIGVLGCARLSRIVGDVAGVRGGWFSMGLGPSLVLRPFGETIGLRLHVLAYREELNLNFNGQTLVRGYWSVDAGLGLETALVQGLDLSAMVDVSPTPGQPVRIGGAEVARNPEIAPLFLLGLKLRIFRGGLPVF